MAVKFEKIRYRVNDDIEQRRSVKFTRPVGNAFMVVKVNAIAIILRTIETEQNVSSAENISDLIVLTRLTSTTCFRNAGRSGIGLCNYFI